MSLMKIRNNNGEWQDFHVIRGLKGDAGHTPIITATKQDGVADINVDGETVVQLTDGRDGRDGADGHTPVMTGSKSGKTSSIYADGVKLIDVQDGDGGGVQDVQVAGQSVVTDGVAAVPIATSSSVGLMRVSSGLTYYPDGQVFISKATYANIDGRADNYKAIVSANLDYAVKAALCDGKGAAYTDTEKAAARQRIGAYGGTYELIADVTLSEDANTISIFMTNNYKKLFATVTDILTTAYNIYFKIGTQYILGVGKSNNINFVDIVVENNDPFTVATFNSSSSARYFGGEFKRTVQLNERTKAFPTNNKNFIVSGDWNESQIIPAGTNVKLYGIKE